MIDVRGAAEVVHHKSHNAHVADLPKGDKALVFVLPNGRAHVFPLKRQRADQVSRELAGEARTDSGLIVVGGEGVIA